MTEINGISLKNVALIPDAAFLRENFATFIDLAFYGQVTGPFNGHLSIPSLFNNHLFIIIPFCS